MRVNKVCASFEYLNLRLNQQTSCPRVLKRQIAYDIQAETSPEHTTAFGTGLPQKMKHIPPKNNTEKMWHCVVIPEDLKSMSAVWDDVSHLTCVFNFYYVPSINEKQRNIVNVI